MIDWNRLEDEFYSEDDFDYYCEICGKKTIDSICDICNYEDEE